MAMIARRAFLGLTFLSLAEIARSEDRRLPPGLTEAEWNSIRWGDAKNGLEAGLRLILPKGAVRTGEKVELGAYLRNRTEAPITFVYYPALWEQTATVIGPDGKRGFVHGIHYSGLPTSVRVTLAPRETLAVDHPGFWMGKSNGTERKLPYLEDPKPGIHRVTQEIAINTKATGRKGLLLRGEVSKTPLIIYSDARKPRRIEADVLGAIQEDLSPSITTGEITVTLATS